MISKEYTILAPEGIHARPATALVRLVKKFKSGISLKKDDKTIQLNSMLNILALSTKGGDVVSVVIDGEDEIEAASAVDVFFNEQLSTL
ncbi:MAG TPA: HPr family phosphocarrier protein [Chryseolinea sp.]|jgi:phosphotransferase system HPr (HPr) family protein|uniref:HPr family phosphocarrier protein n=1 Tax=Dyadobacter pollutisoli TaxID=2910158 RepID=A0A9E8SL49_9BACT|nr:HPr family phosphocarrier protein [Dyadobacter pollutisoli]WAC12648.1 HPr family phosphocarrier protein [Dyadobacter pollutisoli]